MKLLLTVPAQRIGPLSWVANIVFNDMLGIPVEVGGTQDDTIKLSAGGAALTTPSLFPQIADGRIDMGVAPPSLPLAEWDLEKTGLAEADVDDALPVLFGSPVVEIAEGSIDCGVDILGTVFFLLSRYEELVVGERDQHDRFPGTASLAWRAGFLYRPVVDEYVEVLWAMMSRLWPGLERKRRSGRIMVSCDVDQPFDWDLSTPGLLFRSLGADVLQRRSPGRAWRRTRNIVLSRRGDHSLDPYYTFDWYLDVCERKGHKAAFYFIPGHSAGILDGTYELGEERVQVLMRKLAGRGHELGVHGSYKTYRDPARIVEERSRMIAACRTAGVKSDVIGNRQHYLRWDSAETPDHLDAAGFEYDTTGSFADRPGFRYGTSFPFPMWSWRRNAPLNIRQHPLVLMECSVLDSPYLGLGHTEEAMNLMRLLRRNALRHGGDFTLLWHNSHFSTDADRDFFTQIVG